MLQEIDLEFYGGVNSARVGSSIQSSEFVRGWSGGIGARRGLERGNGSRDLFAGCSGLEGSLYINKTDGFKRKQLGSEALLIAKETDRVHLNTNAT